MHTALVSYKVGDWIRRNGFSQSGKSC